MNNKIRKYKLFCLEQSIYVDRLKNYDTFLSNNNFSKNLEELKILVDELKNDIKKLKYFEIEIQDDSKEILEIDCHFSIFSSQIITKINNFLFEYENDSEKYMEIVFPEGFKRRLRPRIEIEKLNFNRIHIGEIPLIIRNIGVGKKCYKTIIKKLGFISSNNENRTKDAELIWKSIIKDNNIYSFICNKKIISFSKKIELEKILKILKDFFKYEIENFNNEIIIDNDFIKKYNIDKL